MPSTINGIGTWYYGQRNRFQRRGTCEQCGATADLKSYDTTLYFVFFFAPLIPLGGKRVLDECSVCQKHKVLKLKEWDDLKEKSVAGANAAVEANPREPAPLIEALGTASGFQHLPQFDAFSEYAYETFPDNPDVLAAVAGGRMYFSQWDLAEEALEKQLAVRPEDAVRRQLALCYLKQLRPDDAQPQLQHIVDGKLAEQVGFLWLLAEGYSATGNHHEARDTYQKVAEIEPSTSADKEFQKRLATATKLAAKGSSKAVASTLLGNPKGASYQEGSRFQLSRWIGPILALGLAALYFWSAISNGQARKVWVVSGLPVAYTARVGGEDIALPPFGRVQRTFPEGVIPVEVADPKLAIEPTSARIETNFFARPFLSRMFVLNPDQAALVAWQKAYYAADPANVPDNEQRITGNRLLHEFSGVDHPFEDFPQQIKVKERGTTSRTRVSLLGPPQIDPNVLTVIAMSVLGPDDGTAVLWRWINAQPDNETALAFVAMNKEKAADTVERLQRRLTDRPVLIEWHRAYQSLRENEPGLIAEYQALLEKEPDSADLAYLLARITEDPAQEKALFERAAQANPPSAYAWNALAIRSVGEGEFQKGLEQIERARELLPGRRFFDSVYEDACLALGEWKRLARIYETKSVGMGSNPDAYRSPRELQFQIWDGNPEGAEALRQRFLQAIRAQGIQGEELTFRERSLERAMQVARGEWDKVVASAKEPNAHPDVEELLLLGRWSDASAELAGEQNEPGEAVQPAMQPAVGSTHILLSLLAGAAGEAGLAEKELAKGVDVLELANRNYKPLVDALRPNASAPDNATLIASSVPTADKRILLIAIAQKFPEQGADLLALAKKLNFQRDISAHLLEPLLP